MRLRTKRTDCVEVDGTNFRVLIEAAHNRLQLLPDDRMFITFPSTIASAVDLVSFPSTKFSTFRQLNHLK